jgi:uncharacterized protein (TIGR02001 family)
MARGSFFTGIVKSGALAAALLAGAAVPGYAGDAPKLALSGSAVITTDYMFRSISNTNQNPAAQVEFDLTYGIFWSYIWSSNTAYGENIEVDYGGGISPKWGPVTFTFGAYEYTYPGATDEIDYFEAKGGASWTTGPWTLAIGDWWSPDNFQFFGESNAIEGTVAYAWTSKLFNFFTPSISGTVGFQSYEKNADDYTYWNAGLTLGFLEHWSADVRYYDTDYNSTQCFAQSGGRNNCDARAVGTIKATF